MNYIYGTIVIWLYQIAISAANTPSVKLTYQPKMPDCVKELKRD